MLQNQICRLHKTKLKTLFPESTGDLLSYSACSSLVPVLEEPVQSLSHFEMYFQARIASAEIVRLPMVNQQLKDTAYGISQQMKRDQCLYNLAPGILA